MAHATLRKAKRGHGELAGHRGEAKLSVVSPGGDAGGTLVPVGSTQPRLIKGGVVADRPGLRVTSVPSNGPLWRTTGKRKSRRLVLLAKVPGNHMSKDKSGTVLPGQWPTLFRIDREIPGRETLKTMDSFFKQPTEARKEGAVRGRPSGRGTRGRTAVRGITWPPSDSGGEAGVSALATTSEAVGAKEAQETEGAGERHTSPQQQREQLRCKRKGAELTPPALLAASDEELFIPRKPEGSGEGTPRVTTVQMAGQRPGSPIQTEEEEEERERLGARPKGKKRRTAASRTTCPEDDSEAWEAGSERSVHGNRGKAGIPSTVGERGGTAFDSPEETPQGVGLIEHRVMSAADLGALIREWLDEIDDIRIRCRSMQGKLSGDMKKRVAWARQALLTLTCKAEGASEPSLLQTRNSELEAQLQKAHRERDELRRKLEERQQEVGRPYTDLQRRSAGTYAQAAGGSPSDTPGGRTTRDPNRTGTLDLAAARRGAETASEGPPTATSAGASEFELRLTGSELRMVPDGDRAISEELARQSAALKEVRNEVSRISRMLLSDGNGEGRAGRRAGAPARSTSDAQTVPDEPAVLLSTAQATEGGSQTTSATLGGVQEPMETGEEVWVEVGTTGGKKSRSKPTDGRAREPGKTPTGPPHNATTATEARTNGEKSQVPRRRAPRTAAVAIKAKDKGPGYAEILKFSRGRVELADLGIGETRLRRAANGGVLIEIPGPDNSKKADSLAAELSTVIGEKYGDAVLVTRPVVKGELRVQGLDDSVSTEELTGVIAGLGGCDPGEVRTGAPRRLPNGLFSAWVQCPLRAASAVAAKGKFRGAHVGPQRRVALPATGAALMATGHVTARPPLNARSARGREEAARTGWVQRAVQLRWSGVGGPRLKKARMARFLQINLNRSRGAQDLLSQSVLEGGVDVCLITEPHTVPPAGSWLGSVDGLAAVHWRTDGHTNGCALLRRGRGYVVVRCGDIVLVSVYISPNVSLDEYSAYLDDLTSAIQSTGANGRGVVVGGDFNGRSRMWDPSGVNQRGELLEGWAASCGLCLHNDGRTPTCVRPQGSSVVDLTWTTPSLVPMVQEWRVLEDRESLSDHRYITFRIGSSGRGGHRGRASHARWSWSRFDPSRFAEALAPALAWGPTGRDRETASSLTAWVERTMSEACDAAAPRARNRGRRKAAFWWNEELAAMRRACVVARRRLTRARRTAGNSSSQEMEDAYRTAKKRFRDSIKAAKARAWEDLVGSVDSDPWGLPYKLVLGKLRTSQRGLTETLDEDTLGTLLGGLFPRGERCALRSLEGLDWNEEWRVTDEEVRTAIRRGSARNVAPGPDGIRVAAWSKVPEEMVALVARSFTLCLRKGTVPRSWKRARLALIPKGGAPDGPIPKVRPICILNELGKTFERVLVGRLGGWVEENARPRLSEDQYGFREGRATSDALIRVRRFVENATKKGGCALAVSLDIANAFNSLPWPVIGWALSDKEVPEYLQRVLQAYLSDRYIEYPDSSGEIRSMEVTAGVPQGSVLGPLLWNLTFDEVLRTGGETGCAVVCYADDTLVLSSAEEPSTTVALANTLIARVCRVIARLGLTVAAAKTEAVLFRQKRRGGIVTAPDVRVGGKVVPLTGSMKYLGVRLDPHLSFRGHFQALDARLGAVTRALGRLMPNLRGPSEARRRLYGGTMSSVLLYGAPVWGDVAEASKPIRRGIEKFQRRICARVVAAYRTASFTAVTLLARSPPLYLVAGAYSRAFARICRSRRDGTWSQGLSKAIKEEELGTARERWKRSLEGPSLPSSRLRRAILANWEGWLDRRHGNLTFRVTQLPTGHGCFAEFLNRIGRAEEPTCWHCEEAVDTASHTLEDCTAWEGERNALRETIGDDLTLDGVIRGMVSSEDGWAAVTRFAERVMAAKERVERERQHSAALSGRRRAGRPRARERDEGEHG
ncbi:uncharacterized protein LOC124409151 [Diprion similis]|uniref:uncharacterized protein LOC124409151 n=1 Tax=Diprion similis TaxID=362088 RepID=UPI001EF766F1|nr:uncharacterized protein LOC124409151 [Diprion similis]